MTRARPIAERLLARIAVTDTDCWEFMGPRRPDGYGVIGRDGGRGAGVDRAHRVSYFYFVGPIPDGLDLDHLCRNRACCNPDHLEPVTRGENLRRGARKTGQTTCKHGHPLDGMTKRQRYCRTCKRESWTRRKERSA